MEEATVVDTGSGENEADMSCKTFSKYNKKEKSTTNTRPISFVFAIFINNIP